MQTFINPTTPFFDEHGYIIPCARVSFVSVDTDSEYIDIYDEDGTALANPLILASDGTFNANEVPYFDDDQTFKVIVEKPTGVTPVVSNGEVINASQLYTLVREFVVKAHENEPIVVNASVVYGINGVRSAAKSLGSVVCVGYNDYDDGCPARVFTWVDSNVGYADNAYNLLRNPNDRTGYWVMDDINGCIDVRMGGVFPDDDASVTSALLTNLVNKVSTSGKTSTLFFPKGNYYVAYSHSFNSAILDSGVRFYPSNASNSTLIFASLENRGAQFCALTSDNESFRVFPRVNGTLYTSWLYGSLNEFLTADVLSACDTIVFDSIAYTGGTEVAISNKKVVVKCSIPSTITFGNCVTDNYIDGSVDVKSGTDRSSVSSAEIKNVQGGHWSKMNGGDIECSDWVKGTNASFSEAVSCYSMTATGSIATKNIMLYDPERLGVYAWINCDSVGVAKPGLDIFSASESIAKINSAEFNVGNKLNVGGLVCESFFVEYPSTEASLIQLHRTFKDAPAGTIVRVRNTSTVITDELKQLIVFYTLDNSKSKSAGTVCGKTTGETVSLGECKQFISLGNVDFVWSGSGSEEIPMNDTIWAVV